MSEGIVRPARRPRGWSAPGPKPAGPRGRPELEPGAGEDLCYLCGDWRIFQHVVGHRWSADDLITGWVAARQASLVDARLAVDLGCGLGSVLLMLAFRAPGLRVMGVEAQPARAALARRSIAWNGVEERCEVVDGDLRDVRLGVEAQLVTCTPPYFPPGTGTEPLEAGAAPSRFEHRGGVEDYLAAACRLLAPGGRVVTCVSYLEVARLAAATAANELVPLERWVVVPREGKGPLIVVEVSARAQPPLGGRAGPAQDDASVEPSGAAAVARPPGPGPQAVERTLTVRDATGQWTQAFRAVREEMGLPPTPPDARVEPE